MLTAIGVKTMTTPAWGFYSVPKMGATTPGKIRNYFEVTGRVVPVREPKLTFPVPGCQKGARTSLEQSLREDSETTNALGIGAGFKVYRMSAARAYISLSRFMDEHCSNYNYFGRHGVRRGFFSPSGTLCPPRRPESVGRNGLLVLRRHLAQLIK